MSTIKAKENTWAALLFIMLILSVLAANGKETIQLLSMLGWWG